MSRPRDMLRIEIEDYCRRLTTWFKDPVAITVVVRNLAVTDGSRDVLVTSEADVIAAADAVKRLAEVKP